MREAKSDSSREMPGSGGGQTEKEPRRYSHIIPCAYFRPGEETKRKRDRESSPPGGQEHERTTQFGMRYCPPCIRMKYLFRFLVQRI